MRDGYRRHRHSLNTLSLSLYSIQFSRECFSVSNSDFHLIPFWNALNRFICISNYHRIFTRVATLPFADTKNQKKVSSIRLDFSDTARLHAPAQFQFLICNSSCCSSMIAPCERRLWRNHLETESRDKITSQTHTHRIILLFIILLIAMHLVS